VQPRFRSYAYKAVSALLCALAVLAAGCHGQGNTSYYGIAWVSLTDSPGDYTTYIVTVDSVTLTRSDGYVITAVATPEVIDFAQLNNISEMWSSGAIPDGTYTSATITLDYTSAVIGVMVNGVPEQATVVDATTQTTGATTYAVTVDFDPNNLPTITPTFASTSATRLAIDFDLAASGWVDRSVSPAKVYVRPMVTVGVQPADTKLIRVRGPLINSSVNVNTYTVYIRPFYDEANNIGTLTLFSQPNTIYTLNGKTYVGNNGLDALSVLSAGTTMTAGYTTFQTDYNPLNGATAGKFNLAYVVAGSSLEDIYTEGMTGDVIARTDDTLTLRGSTLILNTADTYNYVFDDTRVLVGSGTIVTADNNSILTGLNSASIAVGQHITVRGEYSVLADGTTEIDSTGTSAQNTGSVRLQATELWGPLVSSVAGSLAMDVQTINDWPVADYTFTGNGAAAVNPAAFQVDTGSIPLPLGTVSGDPLWVSGFATPFGTAPPDYIANAVNDETSVQLAGGAVGGAMPTTPGTLGCGLGSQVCDPATLEVIWIPGIGTPLLGLSDDGFSLNLNGHYLYSAVIRIGPEFINVLSLPAGPQVVPTALVPTSTFAPRYTVGVYATSTTTSTVTSSTAFRTYSSFPSFISEVLQTESADALGLQLAAKGVYNRTTNTFTATSIDLVL
jgi:hypothetical protein